MHTRSVTVTAAFVAAASFAASTTRAGDTPPLFLWANPVDGFWSNPANWSPQGVPGQGVFSGADVRIDAPSPSPYTVTISNIFPLVRNLTLAGPARLAVNETTTVTGDLTLQDSAWIRGSASGFSEVLVDGSLLTGEHTQVRDSIVRVRVGGHFENNSTLFNVDRLELNRNNTLDTRDINRGLLVAARMDAGFFENAGMFQTGNLDIRIGNFLNSGAVEVHSAAFPLRAFVVDQEFTSSGHVLSRDSVGMFRATTFIHEGIFESTRTDGVLEFTGNHRFTNPDPFRGASRIDMFGSGADPLVLEGVLDTTTPIAFAAQSVDARATLRLFNTSFVIEDHAAFQSEVVANRFFASARSASFAESVQASSRFSLDIDGHVDLFGDLTSSNETVFRAASIHATGHISFTGSLTIREADALFDNSFVVDGSLVVQQGASMKFADGAALRATGNITWSNPGSLLDVPIVAGGQAIIGARRVEAEVTANFIRLGAGTMELAADITSNTTVIIAGTALSLGARGEFTHATINADVATTFALNQSWLFDVGADGERGPASDLLTITGSAQLYGVLNVDLVGNPASLRAGDEFTLLTAASIDGAFLAMNLPTLTGALSWDYFQTDTALGLRVIPSPGAGTLLALVALAHARRDRRSTPTL